MANVSILTALERMWQHIVIALSVKSDISHNHDGVYCTESDASSGFKAINTSIDNIIGGSTKVASAENADLANIANIATRAEQDSGGRIISDTYETKSDAASKYEQANAYTDRVASGKSDFDHNHDLDYDTKGSADEKSAAALASAKGYVDSKVSTLASFTDVNNNISEHNTSTSAHNDIRYALAELDNRINAVADSDDITLDQLSEIVSYIKSNKSLIDFITTNKVNVSDIINDLTTNVANKPLSAAQGVAVKKLIDDLKGVTSSHSTNTTIHITSAERTDWNDANTQKHLHDNKSVLDAITATAEEINILDGVTVSTTELNYIDGLTSNVQAQLDSLSSEKAPQYTYSTTDLTAGTSALATGKLYFVYE